MPGYQITTFKPFGLHQTQLPSSIFQEFIIYLLRGQRKPLHYLSYGGKLKLTGSYKAQMCSQPEYYFNGNIFIYKGMCFLFHASHKHTLHIT